MRSGIPTGAAPSFSIPSMPTGPSGSPTNRRTPTTPASTRTEDTSIWIADCAVESADSYGDEDHHMLNPSKIVVATLQKISSPRLLPAGEASPAREPGRLSDPHRHRRLGTKDHDSTRRQFELSGSDGPVGAADLPLRAGRRRAGRQDLRPGRAEGIDSVWTRAMPSIRPPTRTSSSIPAPAGSACSISGRIRRSATGSSISPA